MTLEGARELLSKEAVGELNLEHISGLTSGIHFNGA